MSAFVIRDVTTASQLTASQGSSAVSSSKSTITSFQKVLESETEKVSGSEIEREVRKASKASKTAASEGAGASTGKASVKLDDIFKRASEKYDISYDFLVAVAKAESDFNTKCVSSAGAMGIMQLMPDECKEFKVTDPYDAEQNIMASAKLLKAHLKKYDGDYTLAAAAYNAGSGAVSKYGGVPPYTETQNYVKKIKKYMKEGVTVPDKTVKVAATETSEGSGGAVASEVEFDAGKMATQKDLADVTVTVGSGQGKVTMSYGAYLKYLEYGTSGVG